jgi:hypothetical protein
MRIGKTSLILTFLNEWKVSHVLLIVEGWRFLIMVKKFRRGNRYAAKQEAEEIKRFLAKLRNEKRYREILKTVAEGKIDGAR